MGGVLMSEDLEAFRVTQLLLQDEIQILLFCLLSTFL